MRAVRKADVIEIARRGHVLRDERCFARADAARHAVIARQFDADDEVIAARRADRGDQFGEQARAVGPVAAVLVGAHVRARRQELMKHVAVARGDFNAGESAAFQARGGLREVGDHRLDHRTQSPHIHGVGQDLGLDGHGPICPDHQVVKHIPDTEQVRGAARRILVSDLVVRLDPVPGNLRLGPQDLAEQDDEQDERNGDPGLGIRPNAMVLAFDGIDGRQHQTLLRVEIIERIRDGQRSRDFDGGG